MLYNIPIDASKSLIKYVKKKIGKLKEQEEIEKKLEEEKFRTTGENSAFVSLSIQTLMP